MIKTTRTFVLHTAHRPSLCSRKPLLGEMRRGSTAMLQPRNSSQPKILANPTGIPNQPAECVQQGPWSLCEELLKHLLLLSTALGVTLNGFMEHASALASQ